MMKDTSRTLPIEKAYEFAKDHGLGDKVQEIKGRNFEELSPGKANATRKGLIIELFEENRIYADFVGKYWPDGSTERGELRRRLFIKFAQEYRDDIVDGDGEDGVDDIEGSFFNFAMESHLRDFLADGKMELIEPGLTLYRDEKRIGVEFAVDSGSGSIDLLAVDQKGKFVVIELKNRKSRLALAQLLYYMAWIDKNIGNKVKPCRGIIIANDLSNELMLSVSIVENVAIKKYKLTFSIEAA